ncbi:MAG: hypothetical protein H0U55_05855, partial [Rubrobacteraceae bacterium]|nr:hypothetical protein [Rubrobacteraceae bacterium]
GAYNTDDMTRAAVVYLRHWRQFGDAHSREAAYGLLRSVAYMQTVTPGPEQGNFVLWMQPDGTLNPSAEPRELPDPSDSGPSYWLARAIWAYGEGYEAFRDEDPAFAAFLEGRMELALDALDRQVLSHYGETKVLDGSEVPAWLIVDGADASSEAVYGLSAYVRAGGDERARRDLAQLADGIARMREAETSGWPFGAILPWAGSRSVWHGWADQMSGSLAEAGTVLGDERLVSTAVGEVGTFTPHLLVQGGAEQGWLPAPIDRSQIAYGADATLQNLMQVGDATGRDSFRRLAGIAGAWYFGNNRSGARMYDPATGRTFDGLGADGNINRNSGAESTIHGLLSMLALDANPDVRERALRAGRTGQLTWSVVEAEAGRLKGDARIVRPESAWTGEGQWSGGAYVELRPGSRVLGNATLPAGGRYRVLPVFNRQQAPERSVGTRHGVDGTPFGIAWQGGAGAPGISPTPGYLDIGNVGSEKTFASGSASISSAYVGDGRPARLDALLVQPEIERLLLTGEVGGQGLLRSWSDERRVTRVAMGSGEVTAYAYDQRGRLVETAEGAAGTVAAPVAPGGFTYLQGSSD